MDKKKRLVLVVAIITLAMLLVGSTFAFLIFDNTTVLGHASSKSDCFIVDYGIENDDGTFDITGTLLQTSGPKTGLSGRVEVSVREDCSVIGEGAIVLNVLSADYPLLYSVDYCQNPRTLERITEHTSSSSCTEAGYNWVNKDHCENRNTLQTMKYYTTEEDCTSAGHMWVKNRSALKYAVYENIDSDPISVGYISKAGYINLHSGITLENEEIIENSGIVLHGVKMPYYVYIWLDGEVADNSYMGANFRAKLQFEGEQTEALQGGAYAIYSETDKSLRFYRLSEPVSVGSTYKGRTVSAIYTGFENKVYATENVPWFDVRNNVSRVVVEDVIRPKGTAYWFTYFTKASHFDLKKLDMVNNVDMTNMFASAGSNLSSGVTFTIVGMNNWNTAKVTSMAGMFYYTAFSVSCSLNRNFNVDDISSWNVANVRDMFDMFTSTAACASNDWTWDLRSWNVANVARHNSSGFSSRVLLPVFAKSYAVYSATDNSLRFYRTADTIIAGSTYNGRVVTNVYTEFDFAATGLQQVPWNRIRNSVEIVVVEDTVSPVSTAYWFDSFPDCSYFDLTNLDTSYVTTMESMFGYSGFNWGGTQGSPPLESYTIVGMENWDTSNVTNMSNMFLYAGADVNIFNISDISNWNTSNVIDMTNMFIFAGMSSSNNWSLDLSGWNVSRVLDYSGFNDYSRGDAIIAPNFD